jgi:hypothetical protein
MAGASRNLLLKRSVLSFVIAAAVTIIFYFIAKQTTQAAFPDSAELYLDKLPAWAFWLNFLAVPGALFMGSFHFVHVGAWFVGVFVQWALIGFASSFLLWPRTKKKSD